MRMGLQSASADYPQSELLNKYL